MSDLDDNDSDPSWEYYDDGWRICDECREGFTWMDDEPYPMYDDKLLCFDCRPEGLTDYQKEDVERLAKTNPIEAIKMYRQLVNVDLRTAKNVIDSLRTPEQREADDALRDIAEDVMDSDD